MNHQSTGGIVQIIGEDHFEWLSQEFDKQTRLRDVPDEILKFISSADITVRDYGSNRNAIITIALITFAYKLAEKVQYPKHGSNDILLLKVLAKNEISRRSGKRLSENRLWAAPLYELITGEVGERIRATIFMTNPV